MGRSLELGQIAAEELPRLQAYLQALRPQVGGLGGGVGRQKWAPRMQTIIQRLLSFNTLCGQCWVAGLIKISPPPQLMDMHLHGQGRGSGASASHGHLA